MHDFSDYYGHLALEITNVCNLKCKMCSVWKEKPKRLASDQIEGVVFRLRERFASLGKEYMPLVTLTGGEPFLHPDFDKIFKMVAQFRKKKMVNGIYIISNGFYTKKVLNFLGKNDTDGLRVDFSVDGLRKNHNYQRGNERSFQNVVKTILSIKEEYPQVPVSVKFMVNRKNYKDLFPIYLFCKKNRVKIRFLIIEQAWNGYYNRGVQLNKMQKSLGIMDNQQEKIAKEIGKIYKDMKIHKIEDMVIGRSYHILSLLRNLSDNKMKKCVAPLKQLFINSHGDVYPCIFKKPVVNINSNGWERKIFGDYHKKIIKEGFVRDCLMRNFHCNFSKITDSCFSLP